MELSSEWARNIRTSDALMDLTAVEHEFYAEPDDEVELPSVHAGQLHDIIEEACTPPFGTQFFTGNAKVSTFTGPAMQVCVEPSPMMRNSPHAPPDQAWSPVVVKAGGDEIDALIRLGVISECEQIPAYTSPVHFIQTGDERAGVRLAPNYSVLNEAMIYNPQINRSTSTRMQTIQHIREEASGYTLFGQLTLVSPLWQIPLREIDRHWTAFHWGTRFFQYNVCPPGLLQSMAMLDFVISDTLRGAPIKYAIRRGSILIWANDVSHFARGIRNILERLSDRQLWCSCDGSLLGSPTLQGLFEFADIPSQELSLLPAEELVRCIFPRCPHDLRIALQNAADHQEFFPVPEYEAKCRPLLDFLIEHCLSHGHEAWPLGGPLGDPHVRNAWTWLMSTTLLRTRRFESQNYRKLHVECDGRVFRAELWNPPSNRPTPAMRYRFSFAGVELLWTAFDKLIYGIVFVVKRWRAAMVDTKFFITTATGPRVPDLLWSWGLHFERLPSRRAMTSNRDNTPAYDMSIFRNPEFLTAAFYCGRGIKPFNLPVFSVLPGYHNSLWNLNNRGAAPTDVTHPIYMSRPPRIFDASTPEDEPSNPNDPYWMAAIELPPPPARAVPHEPGPNARRVHYAAISVASPTMTAIPAPPCPCTADMPPDVAPHDPDPHVVVAEYLAYSERASKAPRVNPLDNHVLIRPLIHGAEASAARMRDQTHRTHTDISYVDDCLTIWNAAEDLDVHMQRVAEASAVHMHEDIYRNSTDDDDPMVPDIPTTAFEVAHPSWLPALADDPVPELLDDSESDDDVDRIYLRRHNHFVAFASVHNDIVGHCSAAEATSRLLLNGRAWSFEEMSSFCADAVSACRTCNPIPSVDRIIPIT